MNVERGLRQGITCRECKAVGDVKVGRQLRNGAYKIEDRIPHKAGCSDFRRAQPKHLKKKNWVSQEKRANALVGARETLMSGSVNEDGDGRVFNGWRVESKQTVKDYYDLTQKTWGKLVTGALRVSEEPLLHVELRHRMPPIRHVVIRRVLYDALTDEDPYTLTDKPRTRHRVCENHGARSTVVELDPPGVELHERHFQRLKEQYDGNNREDL